MTGSVSPTLIVGAGLAGLHMAWSLHLKHRPFAIVSFDQGLPAWKASAGIINPVTGKRVVKSWRIDELLPFAIKRYADISEILDRPSAYHKTPLIRYFRGDPDERARYSEKRQLDEFRPYLGPQDASANRGFEIKQSGWVDVQNFVEGSRDYFTRTGNLSILPQAFDPKSIEFSEAALNWDGKPWSHIVFCEGYQGQTNPYFDWLDYRISRGDVIDFSSDTALPEHILNREKWLLPLSRHAGRTGSTYGWDDMERKPAAEDVADLLNIWSDLVSGISTARITQHRVGIRPGTNDSKPYAGPHPEEPRLCIFNGFGSKGASQSPWCAEKLAAYIAEGDLLPKDIDPRRRLKFLKAPPRIAAQQ